MMPWRAVTMLMGALTACASPRTQAAAPESAATPDTAPVVTLERGACRGKCPIYRVALFADGRVTFTGERFVTPIGTDSARITPASVQAMRDAFDAARFTAMPMRIGMASRDCGAYVADVPTVELSLRTAGALHSVRYDQGCRDYPRVLDTLANRVDSISGTARWTATRGQ